uniref:Anaphase-promoting complex subunit 4 WD40 domain-containing protein n=3 Tax=Clastoptera arizonana TaxID=38151 RepID=A0A1B6CWZ8_9HEMI
MLLILCKRSQMNRLIAVASDGSYFVLGYENILKVKAIDNKFTPTNLNKSAGKIKILKLSPNNEWIAWITKEPMELYIQSIQNSEYHLKLCNDKANLGFNEILWSLDNMFLLVISKHSVYIDVIDIKNKTLMKIDGALSGNHNVSLCCFSPDGLYFAATTRSHPAVISVFKTDKWNKLNELKVGSITDVGGMIWCKDSMSILIWQRLLNYHLTLYSLDGRVEHESKKDFISISNISPAHNGRIISVQTDNFQIIIIDLLTWQETAVLQPLPVIINSEDTCVLKESVLFEVENYRFLKATCFELNDSIVDLIPIDKILKTKTSKQEFSACSYFLATYESQLGEVIWIWNIAKKKLHSVIILNEKDSAVRRIMWHHKELHLVVDIGLNKILIWNINNCFVIKAKDNETTVFNSELYLSTIHV